MSLDNYHNVQDLTLEYGNQKLQGTDRGHLQEVKFLISQRQGHQLITKLVGIRCDL
jgi:hypothetical protein